MNSSTTPGLRINREISIHEFQAFLHANQSQPAALHGFIRIKANTRITYGERNPVGGSAKFYLEATHPAVLYRIVQCFLQNPIKTK